jgi:hypothetical protein
MIKDKKLYVKPKSLLRRFVQKLFLKLLLKFFPNKFASHKDKIKNILNKVGFYLFRGYKTIYLKIKYPHYIRLPFSHIFMLHVLFKFLKKLKKHKINFFLLSGSLLGAVRQESFAGRPSDIDLGIKEDQLDELLKAIPLLIKSGVTTIKKYPHNTPDNQLDRLQILYPSAHIDIAVYRKKRMGNSLVWIGETDRTTDNKFNGLAFPREDLENLKLIECYGKKFLAPSNPELYLFKLFGKDWKTPDKKQFFWNKDKLKNYY